MFQVFIHYSAFSSVLVVVVTADFIYKSNPNLYVFKLVEPQSFPVPHQLHSDLWESLR